MIHTEAINEHIHYFKVPYKDIFVGIYVIRHESGAVLVDTAASDADVDNWIAPALAQLGITPDQVTHIFITHKHRDHSGGLARASVLWPNARIVSRSDVLNEEYPDLLMPEDGQRITDTLQVVTIPGHTADSAALLDLRTNTLVSGDCLQMYGIFGSGDWYGAIALPAVHFTAVEKLRRLPINTIATAHNYHPGGMICRGSEAVTQCLDHCVGALERLRSLIEANPGLDDAQIAQLSNKAELPTVAPRIVAALRQWLQMPKTEVHVSPYNI